MTRHMEVEVDRQSPVTINEGDEGPRLLSRLEHEDLKHKEFHVCIGVSDDHHFCCLKRCDTKTGQGMSECWMFYAVPTARVIFTAETSLDLFSLG